MARNVGDVHPKNSNLVWTEYKPGKFDWRGKDSSSNKSTSTSTKMTDPNKLKVWAETASEDNLLKLAQSKNGNVTMRKVAYDELEKRGHDMSTVDTSGSLDQYMKMFKKPAATTSSSSDDDDSDSNFLPTDSSFHLNGQAVDDITEKWYLNPNDKRVKSKFDLSSKAGRIGYDQFVDSMKRKEKDYIPPIEVIQDLNEQYLEFLTNDEQRFMISAGGAGIGKTYGFHKLAELENQRPFSEGDTPGDGDYDYFEAKDVTSGKQLASILKQHNGKIILFDDTDSVLTRKDCSAIMKKATATTGKRIIGDSDDSTKNFEFDGRIMIMTNKNISDLASDNEDTKAILSRSLMGSEIYLTVPETIEVLESRFQDYEFPQAPRLDDEEEDKAERQEVLDLIKKNQKNIDPSMFTTRTFQSMIIEKRRIEKANEKRNSSAHAALIGSKAKDWKEKTVGLLTKGEEDEISVEKEVIEKSEQESFVDSDILSTDMSIEKAEELLFTVEE